MSCGSWADAQALVNLVGTYAKHDNQAMHNGKVLVSTLAGSSCTFGTGTNNGRQTAFVDVLKANGVEIFFVPNLFSDVGSFQSSTWMNGEMNWNSGWPMGGEDISTSTDVAYMIAWNRKNTCLPFHHSSLRISAPIHGTRKCCIEVTIGCMPHDGNRSLH